MEIKRNSISYIFSMFVAIFQNVIVHNRSVVNAMQSAIKDEHKKRKRRIQREYFHQQLTRRNDH